MNTLESSNLDIVRSLVRGAAGHRLLIRFLAALYVLHVLIFTQMPFHYDASAVSLERFAHVQSISSSDQLIAHLVDMALLMPLGALIACGFSFRQPLLIAGAVGFLMSASIEAMQAFNPGRLSSGVDLLENILGAVLGAALAPRLKKVLAMRSQHITSHFVPPVLYLATITGVLQLESNKASLAQWDLGFHLYFGNEATGDRPWVGNIDSASIYASALEERKIQALYRAEGSSPPVYDSLVTRFMFEGLSGKVVHATQTSPVRFPLQVQDQRPQESEVPVATMLRSIAPASEFTQRLMRSNALSVEVWLTPDSREQTGPARIASLSSGPGSRNFTLAQSDANIEFRVRTPRTGQNGAIRATVARSVLMGGRQHIVATYGKGVCRLFVDGRLVSSNVLATPTLWAFREAGLAGQLSLAVLVGSFAYLLILSCVKASHSLRTRSSR